MPNMTKRFFRRPAVRRCRKVPSKTFKRQYPERYQQQRETEDWLKKPQYEQGVQPYVQMYGGRFKGRPYGNYCYYESRPGAQYFDPITSTSNVSECFTDDSRYNAKGEPCYPAVQPFYKPKVECSPVGRPGVSETSAHRELMFMMDQLEQAELEKIQRDLRQFQTSRRRLMFNLSSLSATSSPPARLLQPVTGAAANLNAGCASIMPPS